MIKLQLIGCRTARAIVAFTAVVLMTVSAVPANNSLGALRPADPSASETDNRNAQGPEEVGRQVAPRLFPRSNYIWPYAAGPTYGRDVVGSAYKDPDVLVTSVGFFRAGADTPLLPSDLRADFSLDRQISQIFLVKMQRGTMKDLYAALDSFGGKLVRPTTTDTVLVRLSAVTYPVVQSLPGLLALEPYHPAFKLDPTIGRMPLTDPERASSDVYELTVQLFADENAQLAARAIAALGGNVKAIYTSNMLIVELHRSLLDDLARLEAVDQVAEFSPAFPHSEETTTTIQTGNLNGGAVPYHDAGVDGSGGSVADPQVLMVLDTGIQLDAGDLSDTKTDVGTPGASHRKVLLYTVSGANGDDLGCDAPAQGGFTHGQLVSATAMGRATNVEISYGAQGFVALDQQGFGWDLDGVALGAKLIAFDGQITPPSSSCSDPNFAGIFSGDLNANMTTAYNNGSGGARVFNYSWGTPAGAYGGTNAPVIDTFVFNNPDAMVFCSAGNSAVDLDSNGIIDLGSLGQPATNKNGFAVGASGNGDNAAGPEGREVFSSTGPAVNGTTVNRIAPQIMAPGGELNGGTEGLSSEFGCRSSDNNQNNPVECDVIQAIEGTSFAAPAAAGAALLMRDYFAQGFYPNGIATVGEEVPSISAALVKAMMVASADFLNGTLADFSSLFDMRFNNIQGYGRIQLDEVLPLQSWSASPTGLIVHDPWSGTSNLGLANSLDTTDSPVGADCNTPANINSATCACEGGDNSCTQTTFTVIDDEQDLRVGLAWVEASGETLVNDLDLVLVSPSRKVYRGNFYTDDNNRDGSINTGTEDCAGIGDLGFNTERDSSEWSLPVCSRSRWPGLNNTFVDLTDNLNPTEGIHLSPNPEGNFDQDDEPIYKNGTCEPASSANAGGACGNDLHCAANPAAPLATDQCNGGTQQVEVGTWTLRIESQGTSVNQAYAVAIAGGVGIGSAARFDEGRYSCADRLDVTITETDAISAATVAANTRIEVRDANNTLVDCEGGSGLGGPEDCTIGDGTPALSFVQDPGVLRFKLDDTALVDLTSETVRVAGNGVLDVRDGDTIKVIYRDGAVERTNTSTVNCQVAIAFGATVFLQAGQDSEVFILGGCERSARGFFESDYGTPDRYMDAGETLLYEVAFDLNELVDRDEIRASLECVNIDCDSPKDCLPTGEGCDPTECLNTTSAPGAALTCGVTQVPCDPRRENNTSPCRNAAGQSYMTILDGDIDLGPMPAGSANNANFNILMAGDGGGQAFAGGATPTVEMILEVSASKNGLTVPGLAVSRQRLNVDEVSSFYSTDFPSGGAQVEDWNNDEVASGTCAPGGCTGTPTSQPGSDVAPYEDYRFESTTWSSLLANGRNAGIQAPWNFDGSDGGFRTGLGATTDEADGNAVGMNLWGEDKNFNRIEDGTCQDLPTVACFRYPTDNRCPNTGPNGRNCVSNENNNGESAGTPLFVKNRNTLGGCGYQTKAPGTCSGDASRGCFPANDVPPLGGDCLGQCTVATNPGVQTFSVCDAGVLNYEGGTRECPFTYQCAVGETTFQLCDPTGQCVGGECNNSVDPLLPRTCTADADCNEAGCQAESGLHTGANNAAVLTDSTANFPATVVGRQVYNTTDGSRCTITARTATTITCAVPLAGGTENDWDTNDFYTISSQCTQVVQACTSDAGTCSGPGTDGGVWHTGKIGPDAAAGPSCEGAPGDACEFYDVFTSTDGELLWAELLVSPELEKVNQDIGSDGLPTHTIEILDFSWNQSVNLEDFNVGWTWEVDTDTSKIIPVDLVADQAFTNAAFGGFGAVTGGNNPELSRGFSLFAGMGVCSNTTGVCTSPSDCRPSTCVNNASVECRVHADCVSVGGNCTQVVTCNQQTVSVNGSAGGNRHGENSCFFEGPGTILVESFGSLGYAQPDDDDYDNDSPVDGVVDEYVSINGPRRNTELNDWNGPDMRFFTLEDAYQDTGNTFQAAIGFLNFEGTESDVADPSFGLAVDDVLIEWREYTLGADGTDCAADGACATIEVSNNAPFEGEFALTVTVLDPTPSNHICTGAGAAQGQACLPSSPQAGCTGCSAVTNNDCDRNGNFLGDADDSGTLGDCDGNGVADVVVLAQSTAELSGEILFLNSSGGGAYRGTLVVSASSDKDGVLFVREDGTEQPTATLSYFDYNDGAGSWCQNSVTPDQWARVETASVLAIPTCLVGVVGNSITDNGDNDGFADGDETVSMSIDVVNNCGLALTNCVATLFSSDPDIDCIIQPQIQLGTIADQAEVTGSAFVFKVGAGNTSDPFNPLLADFNITISCDQVDAADLAQSVSLSLDLDLSPAGTAGSYNESFEGNSAPIGDSFTNLNLDATLAGNNNAEGLLNSDGWRCQYSDPDWVNAGSYGDTAGEDCYPTQNLAHGAATWFHVDDSKSFGFGVSGAKSMYFGIELGTDNWTTPQNVVEAAVSSAPINLGITDPELSFWHQISTLDGRGIGGTPDNLNSDRGVVQLQVVNNAGNPVSDWIKLEPFQNAYDTQAGDNFFNCEFDPVDDGNNEDDFFDPTDPGRDTGPSSTCFPGFSYSCMGDTDGPGSSATVCNGDVDSGEAGNLGLGTWVESKVDLSAYRGRRIKLRFLMAGIKINSEDWQTSFMWNPDPRDDGWWIDDISIDQTLSQPAVLSGDAKILRGCSNDPNDGCYVNADCGAGLCNQPAPGCGADCQNVLLGVDVEPTGTGSNPVQVTVAVPGQPVSIDLSSSTAARCVDGDLIYQFTNLSDPSDGRVFTGNPQFLAAPTASTDYLVEVCCSTDTANAACCDEETVRVNVRCPGDPFGFMQLKFNTVDLTLPIDAAAKNTVTVTTWTGSAVDALDVAYGTFTTAASIGAFTETLANNHPTTASGTFSVTGFTQPAAGQGIWYLAKKSWACSSPEELEFCNSSTWNNQTAAPGQTPQPGATGDRDGAVPGANNPIPCNN